MCIRDRDWYVQNFPDAALLDMEPLEHFVRFGLLLKRDPGPDFDTRHYMDTYPDVSAAGMHAIVHYVRFGKSEGRQPLPPMAQPVSGGPTETAPDGAAWVLRHATDAFGLRGLEPNAPLALVVNVITAQDGATIDRLLGRVPAAFDLFLLGAANRLAVGAFPASVRSLTLLGDADEVGNARGFARLAGSGALDSYGDILWLSPQDAGGSVTDEDVGRLLGLHDGFCADAQWGIAGDRFASLDRGDPAQASLLTALNTALPRLGLSLSLIHI